VVLDTPLLTYREPLKNPKHGELAEDEKALHGTTLDERFYEHPASLKDIGQVLVLENADPPPAALQVAKVHVFTGRRDGTDRIGFFPVQP
jgi:hypothetical protein